MCLPVQFSLLLLLLFGFVVVCLGFVVVGVKGGGCSFCSGFSSTLHGEKGVAFIFTGYSSLFF